MSLSREDEARGARRGPHAPREEDREPLRAKADRDRWSVEDRLRETREKLVALLDDLGVEVAA